MIRCRTCGHANETGSSFCESCGVFLEWTGDVATAAEPPAAVEDDHDYGIVFSTDHAVGETGSVSAPDPVEGIDEADRATEDLSAAPAAAATTVPLPPPGPPPPPAAGTRVDRPPPSMQDARPAGWAPPPRRADGTAAASAEEMRVLTRPFGPVGGVGATSGPATPVRRPRAVEVQSVPDDEDDGRSEEADEDDALSPSFGPSLPGMQRDFTPLPSARSAPTRTPQVGDVLCRACGEANLPTRHFCRRCGEVVVADATDDAVVVARPWWRRVLPRRRPRAAPRPYRAGERPSVGRTNAGDSRMRRGVRRVQKVGRVGVNYLFALLAILALVAAVLPQAGPVRTGIVGRLESTGQRVQRFLVPQYVRVNPVAVSASSALGDHPADDAVDGFSNTWWAEGAAGPGVGQTITVTFQEPTVLTVIAVLNGGVAADQEFTSGPRPRRIALSFDDGSTIEVDLRDEADPQEHRIAAPPTVELTVRILSVYEASADARTTELDASITELEFLRRV